MIINPATYIILVAALIFLSVIVLALILSYITAGRRLKALEDERDILYKKAKEKEDELINQAQSDYHKIVTSAQSKASELISDAGQVNMDTQKVINEAVSALEIREKESLEKKAEEFLKLYEEKIAEVNNNSINSIKNESDELVKYIDGHFTEIKKLLEAQTVESKNTAEARIKEEYGKMEKELSDYKESQLKKIDNNIYEILLNVSKIAFGRGLPLENHEELVEEAIEQAKKEAEFHVN